MLLFQKKFHEGLVDGSVTITFRRWDKPRVKVGGRYRCHPIGVLEVDAIDLIRVRNITAADAKRAGFPTKKALVAYLGTGPKGEVTASTQLYRVELHHGGDGDRVQIALQTNLSVEEVEEIRAKLKRMDKKGPWTMQTLRLIEKRPQTAARILAAELKREKLPFKTDVRKLKKLGLTQSFEIGYEISPRGKAFLEALED